VILGANVENLTLVGTATGGTGNDLDNRLIGNDQANLLIGDEGNDVIEGGDNTDDLRGGAGEDLLDGGLGNDAMNGGTGNDTYVVDSGLDSIVDTGTGIDTVLSSITYTLQSNLENLRLLGTTDLIAIGNTAANTIVGNSGSNIIDGGSNGDNMLGAAGDDSYTVDSLFDIVIEAQNEGTDSVQSSVAFTLGANVENLTLTSSAAGGTGNALDNTINGNSAANTLTGHGGNDTLNGGSGSDTMIGGTGNDTYVVAQAGDVVTENADEGTDTVQSSISYTLGNDVENLTLTSSATTGTGNGLDNVIVGNSSSNTLTGNGGNDTLDGGGGSDSLTGGAGNDSYFVAQTGDTVTEAVGGGTDTVNSTIAYTLSSTQEIENLTLLGSSNVNGTGNALNNVLVGNAGNNTLAGNAGSDTLTGGNGADIYSFSAGHGADTINNASSDSALDRLDVSGITSAQVAFTRSGNDLLMTRTGTPTDNVRVLNWFTDAGSQVDSVRFISNNVTLTAAQINAMFPSLMSSTERSLAVFVDAMNHFGGRRDFVVDRIRASDPEAQADWLAPAEAGSGLRFQGGPAERRQLV
jgi:Ca2+-binding RTX toxin-like protein